MPKFTLVVPVGALQEVTVEADNIDQAKDLIVEGKGEYGPLFHDPDRDANTDTSTFYEVKRQPTEKTKSWTDAQMEVVAKWTNHMADEISQRINLLAASVRKLDNRPRETWTPEKPDVYFRYVEQAMLEDLIAELQDRV